MRLMESLLDHSSGLRVVATRYTGAYFPPHHFLVDWRSEPPCFLNYDVQSRSFQLGVHSHIFGLTFRATIFFQFGVQSHHPFLVMAFRTTISLQLGVQSRHHFSVTTFRVVLLGLTFRDVSS